jgi:alcohol dehydrogenase, propanol-preferring
VEAWVVRERNLRSVTANTRAARVRLHVTVTPYPLSAAGQALADLAADKVNGAAILIA